MAAIPPHLTELRSRVRERARNLPGVYRLRDGDGSILYVGQSTRLRTRLLSYFRAPPLEKAGRLIRQAERLEWRHLPDPFTALLVEYRMIRRLLPRWNVQHRRKRPFAFVRIVDGGSGPARLRVSSGPGSPGEERFGPFPSPKRVARVVEELNRTLGLRDCANPCPTHFRDQLEILPVDRVPGCVRGELGACLAPCASGCSAHEYEAALDEARRFLLGRTGTLLPRLRERMLSAASARHFEHAALLRDRLLRLEAFQEQARIFRKEVDGLSFLYRPSSPGPGGRMHLVWKGRIRLSLPASQTVSPASARERVRERLAELVREEEVFPPGAAGELFLVARWFLRNPEERRRTVRPERWLGRPGRARAVRDGGEAGRGFSPGDPPGRAGGSPRTPPRGQVGRKAASA